MSDPDAGPPPAADEPPRVPDEPAAAADDREPAADEPAAAADDREPAADEPAAAADDRESAYVLLQRGRELLAGRHHAQAAVVLARAAALEPGRGSILEPLGRACFMAGQLDRAVEAFEALLVVDPTSHYGHYALGRALIRLGRTDEGRTHLRLAVALAPDSKLYRGGLHRLGGAGDRAGRRD